MARKKVSKPKAVPVNKVEVTELTRVFEYSGLKLQDIGTDKSVQEVKDFYAGHYPELVNADVKGPVTDKGVEKWTFVKKVGPKG